MATHKKHTHTVLTTQTALYELLEHPLQPTLWPYTRTRGPKAMQRAQLFPWQAPLRPSKDHCSSMASGGMVDIVAGPAQDW